ncbi:MAG: hypothetical protein AABZ44_01400 [Elusimicrobiota bacterium]
MRKIKSPDRWPATKTDIANVHTELKAAIKAVRAELTGTRIELKADITNVKTELKADITNVKTELKAVGDKVSSLDQAVKQQALKLLEHDQRFDNMENLIKSSTEKILSAVDAFGKETIEVDRLQVMQGQHIKDNDDAIKAHGNDIKDLGVRVTRIEKATAI